MTKKDILKAILNAIEESYLNVSEYLDDPDYEYVKEMVKMLKEEENDNECEK